MRSRRREIQITLYHAYRRRGAPADLFQVKRNIPDLDTGEDRIQVDKIVVPLISFKYNQRSLFDYDIGYIKANSNFVYGGQYEAGDRVAFFSTRDLSKDFVLKKEDYFVIANERFNIFRFDRLDDNAGYIVHLRVTKGQAVTGQVFNQHVFQILDFEQTINEPETQVIGFQQTIGVTPTFVRSVWHDLDFTQETNHV